MAHHLRLTGLLAAVLVTVACSDPEVAKREFLESGNRFFEQGQYEEAIVEYRNAVQQDERFGEARLKLAEAFEKTGNASGAFRQAIRAADLLPENIPAQMKAATFLLLAQQWEDAKTRVQRVLDREPGNVAAQVLLGTAMAGLRDFDGAITEIEEAIGLDPSRGSTYASLAAVRLAQGEREDARQAFERAVAIEPNVPTTWLALAQFQLDMGEVQEAETSLQRVVALDPRHVLANRALAAIYLSTGRDAEAERPLKVVVDATATGEARLMLADYYLRLNRLDDARTLLRSMQDVPAQANDAELRLAQIAYSEKQVAQAHAMLDGVLARTKHIPSLVAKAQWLLLEGKTADALARANEAVSAAPQSVEARYLLGSVHVARRDIDAAVAAFNEVLRVNPRALAAQLQLSRLLLARGDAEGAVQYADAVVRDAPDSAVARVALARGLIARRETERASTEVAALLKAYPNVAVVRALHGSLRLATKDLNGARGEYERAFQLDPRSFEAIAGLVTVEMLGGRPAKAREFAEAQVAAQPEHPDLLVLAARVYASERDMPSAERALRKAIELDTSNSRAYGLLGQVLLSQRKLDEALREFDSMVQRNPGDLGAATMAGIIVQSQGNLPEAKKRYAAIVARNPRAVVAANNLAWMYAEDGERLDEALTLAQSAVAAMPDLAEVQDTLGWVYYKRELPVLAIEPFERSIERDPDNPTYHYHLALALARSGEADKAKRAAAVALQLKPDYADARQLLASLEG